MCLHYETDALSMKRNSCLATRLIPSQRRPVLLLARILLRIGQACQNRSTQFHRIEIAHLLIEHISIWRKQESHWDGPRHIWIERRLHGVNIRVAEKIVLAARV